MIKKLLLVALLLFLPVTAEAQQAVPGQSVILLAEDTIQKMLDRSDGSDYQLECLTRLPPNITLPNGILDMSAELMGQLRYGQPIQVKVAVNVDGMRQMNIITIWRVRKFMEVLVAARDLPSQTTLEEADMVYDRREVTRVGDVIFQSADAVGLQLRRPLTVGSVITRSSLTKPEAIKAGDNVTIVSIAGNVTVKVAGQAVQGGAVGDVIRVRNLSSGKSLLAKIQDRDTVVIYN